MARQSIVGALGRASLVAVFAALIFFPAHSLGKTAAHSRAFFWQVKKGKKVAYLLGSVHMATKSMYPLSPAIESAFSKSDVIVLEARPDAVGQAQALALQKGMFRPPDSLKKHLSKKAFMLVSKAAKRLGLPVMAVERMRPWLIAMTLVVLEFKGMGYDEKLGIEMHFFGKRGDKAIKELEGAKFQIDLLSSFSNKMQEQLLLYTLKDVATMRREMTRMVSIWQRGDHQAMDRLLKESVRKTPQFRLVYKRIMTDRNVKMAKKVDAMLRGSKMKHFVIVGAGHLVGKKGLVALLKKRGYTLKQY